MLSEVAKSLSVYVQYKDLVQVIRGNLSPDNGYFSMTGYVETKPVSLDFWQEQSSKYIF